MSNNPEEARNQQREKALSYYNHGEHIVNRENYSVHQNHQKEYLALLDEAIHNFDESLSIAIRLSTNDYQILNNRELSQVYENRAYAYLKYSYKDLDKPGDYLKQAIEDFSQAANQCHNAYDTYEVSTTEWEKIRLDLNKCIEKYNQGLIEQTIEFFEGLIIDNFGQLINQKASEEKVKNAIKALGKKVKNFEKDILLFYAKYYEYRGYSFKRCANFEKKHIFLFNAKNDLQKSISIYKNTPMRAKTKELKLRSINKNLKYIERLCPNYQLHQFQNFILKFYKRLLAFVSLHIANIYSHYLIIGYFSKILDDLIKNAQKCLRDLFNEKS